jgi:hypothetical protein
MAVVVAAMSGVPVKMQDATTTGNGTVIACPPSFRNHNIMITAAAGVNAGAITVEASNDPADAGTWAAIVADKSVANPLSVVAGADLLFSYTGLLNFVRARISTTISGGGTPSVTVTYEGAKSY